MLQQTVEHVGGHGASPQQFRGDPADALIVRAEGRDQQGQSPGVGDGPGQGILRSLNVGRIVEAPQVAGFPTHPEVAELVADQVADQGIGVRQSIEQQRHSGGIGTGPS